MRYLDLITQSLILIVFVLCLVDQWHVGQDRLMIVFLAQMILGAWQMLSSLISILAQSPFHKLKITHFFVSLVYLFLLVIVVSQAELSSNVNAALAIVPAWLLAGFYFYITCRWAFARQRKAGKFLPNVFY